jgi:outer membrane protein W
VRIYWNPQGNNTFEYFVYDNLSGEKIVIADYQQIIKFTHMFYKHDQTKDIKDYYSMPANPVLVFT